VAVLSFASNTARHDALSTGVFDRRQAVILVTLGISDPHNRNTSGVQAICCCMVPRYSSASADVPPAKTTAKLIDAKIWKIRRFRMIRPFLFITWVFARPSRFIKQTQSMGPGLVRAEQKNVSVRAPEERLLHPADALDCCDEARTIDVNEL
jgi:hypothetical protein